jgi:hypothetical protein
MSVFRTSVLAIAGPVAGLCILVGCETGHTVSQDKTVRTRSDGTVVKDESKTVRQSDGDVVRTETHKVDHP